MVVRGGSVAGQELQVRGWGRRVASRRVGLPPRVWVAGRGAPEVGSVRVVGRRLLVLQGDMRVGSRSTPLCCKRFWSRMRCTAPVLLLLLLPLHLKLAVAR